jgi:hypothetical protein
MLGVVLWVSVIVGFGAARNNAPNDGGSSFKDAMDTTYLSIPLKAK